MTKKILAVLMNVIAVISVTVAFVEIGLAEEPICNDYRVRVTTERVGRYYKTRDEKDESVIVINCDIRTIDPDTGRHVLATLRYDGIDENGNTWYHDYKEGKLRIWTEHRGHYVCLGLIK